MICCFYCSYPPKAIIYSVVIGFIDIIFQRKLLVCRENKGRENAYNVQIFSYQVFTNGKPMVTVDRKKNDTS